MILGFAGRLESGKTTLAEICQTRGFRRLYFGMPLKELVRNIIGCDSIDELNSLKNEKRDYKLTNENFEYVSNETGIALEDVKTTLSKETYSTVRELLQVIGTDLIRKYNEDWHVDKLRDVVKELQDDGIEDIVFDDVRFTNELLFIRSIGGSIWYVMRKKFDNISHHESEENLEWQYCDYNIFNYGSLSCFRNKWREILSHYEESVDAYDKDNPYSGYGSLREEIISKVNYYYNISVSGPLNTFRWYDEKANVIRYSNDEKAYITYQTHFDNYTRMHRSNNPIFLEESKKFVDVEDFPNKVSAAIPQKREDIKLEGTLAVEILLKEAICSIAFKDDKKEYDLNGCVTSDKSYNAEMDYLDEWSTFYEKLFIDEDGTPRVQYKEFSDNKFSKLYDEKVTDLSMSQVLVIANFMREEIEDLNLTYRSKCRLMSYHPSIKSI